MRNKNYIISVLVSLLIVSCNSTPEIDNSMLDSGTISYANPDSLNKHLVSKYIPSPSEIQLNTPIIIVAHGFSATTFEWDEFREYANAKGTFYVSQVLLGGHGRSYAAFKAAKWEDWQASIKDEYKKLSDAGFKKIYLAGSSTGAPLIINLLESGFFENLIFPKGIFLVDPIIIPSNKMLNLIELIGPVMGYSKTDLQIGEQGHWYVYRPQEALKELKELINLTRTDLQKGILLPENFYLKVYKSTTDNSADPISATLIYNGMKTALGNKIEVEMVNSKLHVFTRLRGRDVITEADKQLQQHVFNELEMKMNP